MDDSDGNISDELLELALPKTTFSKKRKAVKKRRRSDSEETTEESEESDDYNFPEQEVGSESESASADEYGEDLMGDDADRKYLMSLTEKL